LEKWREKRQTPPQVFQAAEAVRLYYKLLGKVPFTPVERTDSREPKGETSGPVDGEGKGAAVSAKRMENFPPPSAKREAKSPFPTNKPAKRGYTNVIVTRASLEKVQVQELRVLKVTVEGNPLPRSVSRRKPQESQLSPGWRRNRVSASSFLQQLPP
jgi:hypothetical protein